MYIFGGISRLCMFITAESLPGTVSLFACASSRRPGSPSLLSWTPGASGCCRLEKHRQICVFTYWHMPSTLLVIYWNIMLMEAAEVRSPLQLLTVVLCNVELRLALPGSYH